MGAIECDGIKERAEGHNARVVFLNNGSASGRSLGAQKERVVLCVGRASTEEQMYVEGI